MSNFRLPFASLPLAAGLLAVIIGCSHPLEVDVPAGYTGKVTVLCDRFAEDGRPIQVGADGNAMKAVCPRSRQTLVVVRGGQAIKPTSDPRWSTTGDGILLAVEFNVD